jgi:metal-responsive CopG/Arc/MetJ family transcriptional regulator
MKIKTSITLSEDLLQAVDQQTGVPKKRSEFIETVLWTYIAQVRRAEQNARDLEIINRHADHLNDEAVDVLDYQAIP